MCSVPLSGFEPSCQKRWSHLIKITILSAPKMPLLRCPHWELKSTISIHQHLQNENPSCQCNVLPLITITPLCSADTTQLMCFIVIIFELHNVDLAKKSHYKIITKQLQTIAMIPGCENTTSPNAYMLLITVKIYLTKIIVFTSESQCLLLSMTIKLLLKTTKQRKQLVLASLSRQATKKGLYFS